MSDSSSIIIKGARVNNLKDVSVEIPRGKFVVITGISGSGKSSLAFDTLFAEGQRRFAESLSSYARQFLGRMVKPDVEKIEGIPPAIAIEQKVNTRNPRSTVATSTEIFDYLRIIFARIGRTYSPISGKEVKCHTVKDVFEYVLSGEAADVYLLADIGWSDREDKVELMEKEIVSFLKGNNDIVTNKLKDEINKESEALHFEKALELKNLLDDINVILVKQKIEVNDNIDRDIFGYFSDGNYLSVFVFFVRGSRIAGHHHQIIPLIDDEGEELTRYIAKFYDKALIPSEVLVPSIVDSNLLSDYFKVKVKVPEKGVKKRLVDMAADNARKQLEDEYELVIKNEEKTIKANDELREKLGLEKLDRIELFDNAHLFGTYNVSGMVVFIDGSPAKNEYRKFKISVDKNDDYGTMREVIYRRYFRVLKDNLVRPDLIIVDGGLGQMNVAKEVLDSLGMDINLAGLKKDDKHATRALVTFDGEIPIEKRSNLFHYLERMQDEVHNFTINYHKQIRSKGLYASILDDIPGIGKQRKQELLKKYKTVSNMKKQSIEELSSVLPYKVALELKNILDSLDKEKDE